jgi:stage II sporulation protein R
MGREGAFVMVKRHSFKHFFYLVFAILVLLASWEATRGNAALAASDIPQEAIRLRILANSDSPSDQWIKRQVRDAVIAEMQTWVSNPNSIEEARGQIRAHLPEIRDLIAQVLTHHGYHYTYAAELGTVPFPTKMYGDKVYPAGNYEALRITLGEGKGQNWWCVLFPPLCFVDSVSGEAVASAAVANDAKKAKEADDPKAAGKESKSGGKQTAGPKAEAKNGKAAADLSKATSAADAQKAQKTEFHFFLWDLLKKIISLFQ